jgi:hypothetical protein
MRMLTATGKFFCHCGAETHAVMDGYQQGTRIVNCWKCDHAVGLAPATSVWSASTAQGARRKRLHEIHDMAVHWDKPQARQRSA